MRKKVGLGSRKDLDAQLNLTPFIDLLSTIVCFLLITAVWIEIGSVEIKQSHGTDAAPSKKISYDLDVVYRSKTALNLNLKRNGKRVKSFHVKGEENSGLLANMDQIIQKQILKFRGKAIEIGTATLTPKSTVNYGEMIQTFDVLRKNNIINIGVLSAKGR